MAYEYFRFRLDYQTSVIETLHKHLKSIRPNAIFCPNGSAAVATRENRPSLQEVFHPGLEEHFDALKNDGSDAPI